MVPTSWESAREDIQGRQSDPTKTGTCWGHDPQLQNPPLVLSKHLTAFWRTPSHKGNTDRASIQLPWSVGTMIVSDGQHQESQAMQLCVQL